MASVLLLSLDVPVLPSFEVVEELLVLLFYVLELVPFDFIFGLPS